MSPVNAACIRQAALPRFRPDVTLRVNRNAGICQQRTAHELEVHDYKWLRPWLPSCISGNGLNRIVSCGQDRDEPMKRHRGFSLLELLIVVAIILIIATIAIPSLLRSRQSANESAAVASLRNLNTAQVAYLSTSGGIYGSVNNLVSAGLLDSRYQSLMSGYDIVVTLSVDSLDFTGNATARGPNDGRFDYFTRPDYVIRYSNTASRAPTGLSGEPVR